jgi:circadian clock protein KaiC
MLNVIDEFKPDAIVVDPVSNFINVGNSLSVKMMLSRLVDFIKEKQITSMFISLLKEGENANTAEAVSSLMDTWIMLRFVQSYGERNRVISIIKSRGMKNSNQMREVIFSNNGIDLDDVYIEAGEPLTGTAKIQQSVKNKIIKTEQTLALQLQEEELKNNQKKLREQILRSKEEIRHIDKQMLKIKIDQDVVGNIMDQAEVKMSSSRMLDKKNKKGNKKI